VHILAVGGAKNGGIELEKSLTRYFRVNPQALIFLWCFKKKLIF
jgi:hypothetical protein